MPRQVTEETPLFEPSHELVQKAARRALEQRVDEADVQRFFKEMQAQAAPAIGATASLNLAVWGKLICEPDPEPWKYDNSVWGGPAYFGSAVGFMYTAYDSWDAFFRNTTSAHVQGIIEGGGFLQINWFRADGTPIGQFNGAAGGIGLVEAGGAGKWKHK